MTKTNYAMLYKSDMFEKKKKQQKTNQFTDTINFFVIEN